MAIIAGYDVGGAHLKVALAANGAIQSVEQIACPLWLGLDRLKAALQAASPLTCKAEFHAVTMTGELSDIFVDRPSGVRALISELEASLAPKVRYWCGLQGFRSAEAALRHPVEVASTNFLATATLVARHCADAMLVDMGSTTVDIVPLVAARVVPIGLTDAERLESGSLLYTGLTRTPIMAITGRAPFKGRWQGLAREHFATMADARRIIGELPTGVDQHESADKRGKSVEESIARFARMFGRDAMDGTTDDWCQSARAVIEEQKHAILQAVHQVLCAVSIAPCAPIVAAGIGSQVVGNLAGYLGRACQQFADVTGVSDACRLWANRCAPAVAAALLLEPADR
jgi:(4-(4-[2-(gamma-L-glutamylamino)ethyl]phenoxymethyl)furan-2-yl)methanamine synthase